MRNALPISIERRWTFHPLILVMGVFFFTLTASVHAEQKQAVTPKSIRSAVAKSLPLLEKSSAQAAKKRSCFTCHHQALPVLALSHAKHRGFAINEKNFQQQIHHTANALAKREKGFHQGKGKVIIDGYALWTLKTAGAKSNSATTAAVDFLLTNQRKADHWKNPGHRPPSVGSDFTTTYVALRGLAEFGTAKQQPAIDARKKTVAKWLLHAKPQDTEDHVFHLRALRLLNAEKKSIHKARAKLLALQNSDGGWAQTTDLKSDAYATGSALAALNQAGELSTKHEAYQRGLQYLLQSQLKDGSWHVKTRAKPFQTYFESGFPHGTDQFISIAGTSWATLALLLDLPMRENQDRDDSSTN